MKEISSIQEAEEYVFNFDFLAIVNDDKSEIRKKLEWCEKVAIRDKQDKLLCRARTYLLYLCIEENNLKKASAVAEENLHFAKSKGLDSELLYMISIVAHLYQLTGDYSASEELIQIALAKLDDITDDLKRCKIYLMIADQYFFTNHKEKCIDAYHKCLDHALKTKDHGLIAICYNNLSDRLLKYNFLDEVPDVLEKGKSHAIKSNKPSLLAQINEKYGAYYSAIQDYQNARKYLEKQLAYCRETHNIKKEMDVSLDLANVYTITGKYKKAFELLVLLEKNALATQAKRNLKDTYFLFMKFYEKKNKFKEALDYLKKFNEVNTQIHTEQSDEKVRQLQVQHDVKTIRTERDNAAKLARIKHDFLSNMSHEIRTPVNSILGVCYLLQQDELSEKQSGYITRLKNSGQQLLGIINDVLDISKIEAGKFYLENNPFSLQHTATTVFDSLSAKAISKGLDFSMKIDERLPTGCIGDSVRLSQILTNLLFNAIKFTPEGHVKLEITVLSLEKNQVEVLFSIQDSGIGMSPEQLQKIFNEYEQADTSTQHKFGGTGLGLSITKNLVELMKGNIEVRSEINKGSEFNFRLVLPISEDNKLQQDERTYSCDALSEKLIFIADDIDENRKVMYELLHSLNSNIQVDFAKNGKEIVELVAKNKPDIIFMDLDMPEMNGFEATRIIKNNFNDQATRIIACSASLLTITKNELMDNGFDDLLQKPFTIKQLVDVLSYT